MPCTILLDLEGTLLDTRAAVHHGAGSNERELEYLAEGPLELYPGVAELLQGACAGGHRLALVTLCSPDYTRTVVRRFQLERWLHCWFCGPDKADLVAQALRELGRPACLLGDRRSDAAAAMVHRVEVFGAGWSYSEEAPEPVLAQPLDLLRRIG